MFLKGRPSTWKREVSTCKKRENLNLKREVSICSGLRKASNQRHTQGLLCLQLWIWVWMTLALGLGSRFRLWLRLTWCIFEACRWSSIPPLPDTRWDDEENSTARPFNTREQILRYERNNFLVVEMHCQEAIHPRWIFVLASVLLLKDLFEWWVCLWQCSHGWRSKQWSLSWPTPSQCWHLQICSECGRWAGSRRGEDEPSCRNPALWN